MSRGGGRERKKSFYHRVTKGLDREKKGSERQIEAKTKDRTACGKRPIGN